MNTSWLAPAFLLLAVPSPASAQMYAPPFLQLKATLFGRNVGNVLPEAPPGVTPLLTGIIGK